MEEAHRRDEADRAGERAPCLVHPRDRVDHAHALLLPRRTCLASPSSTAKLLSPIAVERPLLDGDPDRLAPKESVRGEASGARSRQRVEVATNGPDVPPRDRAGQRAGQPDPLEVAERPLEKGHQRADRLAPLDAQLGPEVRRRGSTRTTR